MIHLLECRGLKVDVSTARRTGFEPNPFAEITVFGERRLTEIESTTSSVLWDRQFVFRSTCTPYEFNRAELSIKLWHANVVLRDELIGQVGTLLSPRAAIPSLPSLLTPIIYIIFALPRSSRLASRRSTRSPQRPSIAAFSGTGSSASGSRSRIPRRRRASTGTCAFRSPSFVATTSPPCRRQTWRTTMRWVVYTPLQQAFYCPPQFDRGVTQSMYGCTGPMIYLKRRWPAAWAMLSSSSASTATRCAPRRAWTRRVPCGIKSSLSPFRCVIFIFAESSD